MGWQPVPPPRRPVLFINPRSGGGTAMRLSLADRAREMGIDSVVLEPGQDLASLVAAAVDGGADALGMAGVTGRRRSSPPRPALTVSPSPASPPARATTSLATSAWCVTT
jgi:hypothetical protein